MIVQQFFHVKFIHLAGLILSNLGYSIFNPYIDKG
jgi:hypothetical protein